jgi:hypothetical protein
VWLNPQPTLSRGKLGEGGFAFVFVFVFVFVKNKQTVLAVSSQSQARNASFDTLEMGGSRRKGRKMAAEHGGRREPS